MIYFRILLLPAMLFGLAMGALAQGTSISFGTLGEDSDQPIEVTSDNLNVDQESGEAVFTGNVVIGMGEMRLTAARVLVVDNTAGEGINRMVATGGVTVVSGTDAAEADQADYSVESGVIVMTGNALLVQGNTALSADKMTIRLSDGTAQMTGRVKTILQRGGNN